MNREKRDGLAKEIDDLRQELDGMRARLRMELVELDRCVELLEKAWKELRGRGRKR